MFRTGARLRDMDAKTTTVYVMLDGSGDYCTNKNTAGIRAGKRQCKVREMQYEIDADGFFIEPETTPTETPPGPETCHGSGYCEICMGTGTNRRLAQEPECETCDGSGECPCLYNMHYHPAPSSGQWDEDDYREFRVSNGLGWQG